MSSVDWLLDAAMKATGAKNDTELAGHLGIKPAAVSNYRRGVSLPNPVVCATLAGLTGEPLAKVIGIVGESRAISREEKAVWRKLAGSVALVLCAIGLSSAGFENAHAARLSGQQVSGPAPVNAYYVKSNAAQFRCLRCSAGTRLRRPAIPVVRAPPAKPAPAPVARSSRPC